MTLTFRPQTGRGSVRVQLASTALNMSAVSDAFPGPGLGPLWLASAAPSVVTVVPGLAGSLGRVDLDTSTIAATDASIYTATETLQDVDAEVDWQVRVADVPKPASDGIVLAELALVSTAPGSLAQARAFWRLTASGALEGVVEHHDPAGSVIDTVVVVPAVRLQPQRSFTLRMLRTGSRVLASVGAVRYTFAFVPEPAQLHLRCNNGAAPAAGTVRIVSSVTRYTRRPVVTFGGQPTLDLIGSADPGAALCTVPTARSLLDAHAAGVDADTVAVATTGAFGVTDAATASYHYQRAYGQVWSASGKRLRTA